MWRTKLWDFFFRIVPVNWNLVGVNPMALVHSVFKWRVSFRWIFKRNGFRTFRWVFKDKINKK